MNMPLPEPNVAERSRRRAAHLRARASRRPIGSNGQRKDLAEAGALEHVAAEFDRHVELQRERTLAAHGVEVMRYRPVAR